MAKSRIQNSKTCNIRLKPYNAFGTKNLLTSLKMRSLIKDQMTPNLEKRMAKNSHGKVSEYWNKTILFTDGDNLFQLRVQYFLSP